MASYIDSYTSTNNINNFKQNKDYSQFCFKKLKTNDKIKNNKIVQFPRFPFNRNNSQKIINELHSTASIQKSIILEPNTFRNSIKIIKLSKFRQNISRQLKNKTLFLSFNKTKYNNQNKTNEKKSLKENIYKKYKSEDYKKDNLSQINLIATKYKKRNDNILNIVPNEDGFSIRTFYYKNYSFIPKKIPNVMRIHNDILMNNINSYFNSVKKESKFNNKDNEENFITLKENYKNINNFKKKHRSLSEKNIIENELNNVMKKLNCNVKK